MGMKFPQNGFGMKFPQIIRWKCILFIILPLGWQRHPACQLRCTPQYSIDPHNAITHCYFKIGPTTLISLIFGMTLNIVTNRDHNIFTMGLLLHTEEDLQWKMTSNGRQPLTEDNL